MSGERGADVDELAPEAAGRVGEGGVEGVGGPVQCLPADGVRDAGDVAVGARLEQPRVAQDQDLRPGACSRTPTIVEINPPGAIQRAARSPPRMARRQVSSSRAVLQTARTGPNPVSLPPTVIVTRVVSAETVRTCRAITSPLVAPLHATLTNDAGSWRAAHSAG